MSNPFPSNRQFKTAAKALMRKTMPLWMGGTLLLVVLQVGGYFLRLELGGVLRYFLADMAEYPAAASGIFPNEGGFTLLLRLDLLGFVVGIPLTFVQLQTFVLVNLLTFVLLAPLTMAVLERYWLGVQGGEVRPRGILKWYANPALAVKAVLVQLVLGVAGRLLGMVAMAPGVYLYLRVYSGGFGPIGVQLGYWALAAMAVMLVGGLLTFFVNSTLLPIQFRLAADPESSLGEIFRDGWTSIRGMRWRFCTFRLSYLGWFILSQLTYGAMDVYILPYTCLGSMAFLRESARRRETGGMEEIAD